MKTLISGEVLDILNFLHDPTFIIDPEGFVIGWNKPMEILTGIKANDMIGKGNYEYSLPFYHIRRPILINLALDPTVDVNKYYSFVGLEENSLTTELYLPNLQGGSHFLIKAKRILNEKGDLIGAIQSVKNITEQVLAEEMLAENEEKFNAFFHDSMNAIIITEIDGKIIDFNQKSLKLLNFTQSELQNKILFDLIPSEVQNKIKEHFLQIPVKENLQIEGQLMTKDNKLLYVEIQANLFEVCGKKQVQSNIYNITDKKLADDALKKSKELLAVTLRSIGDGVISTDKRGTILLMNKVAEQLTGWTQEEALGKHISEVFHVIDTLTSQERENPVDRTINNGGFEDYVRKISLVSKSGEHYAISESGKLILDSQSQLLGVVIVFRDITQRQKMEENFYKNQKIESIGVLAGGIAHDFNNFLTTILGNLSIAKLDLEKSSDLFDFLDEAEKACIRARDLTKQLLTFSKGGAPIKQVSTITELIIDTANFALRGSKNTKIFEFQENLWAVDVDKGQISQVLNNILINADQAMEIGGTISISATNLIPSKSKYPYLSSNQKYLYISIKDEGIGIPEENLMKIFDPYFTTKEQGNGLGLAVAHSIVKNHGGTITVESEISKGTKFNIFLPAIDDITLQEKNSKSILKKCNGRVLVMDDDPTILKTYQKMLNHLGYIPIISKTGEELLEKVAESQKNEEVITCIILDLTVSGGMGGKETMRELLKRTSTPIKVIVSSGYSTDPVMANYRAYKFSNTLIKPFTIKELSDVLNSINH